MARTKGSPNTGEKFKDVLIGIRIDSETRDKLKDLLGKNYTKKIRKVLEALVE